MTGDFAATALDDWRSIGRSEVNCSIYRACVCLLAIPWPSIPRAGETGHAHTETPRSNIVPTFPTL